MAEADLKAEKVRLALVARKAAFAHSDADAMRDFVVNKLGYDKGNIIDLRYVSQADLMATRGGSGKLDSLDKWIFGLGPALSPEPKQTSVLDRR